MVVKKGKSMFRAALDDDLITEVKIAAAKAGVNPNTIAEAALRMFLNDEQNFLGLKKRKSL